MSVLLAPGSPEESLLVATTLLAELQPLVASARQEQAAPFAAALDRLPATPDEHASEPLVNCLLTIAHYLYLAARPATSLSPATAAGQGLRLPVAYNTSGWERREVLALLDEIVDIYLPDFKYWDGAMSAKFSAEAESYPEITEEAILEMNRQVGVARLTNRALYNPED